VPRLDHITSPDAAEILRRTDFAILPIGATEQHGPHLAMGLDYMAAEWLADRVARDIECVVTPVIPVGFSRQWMRFPGTLSLRRETVGAVVDDLVKSLIHHGIDRVLIINGHGRNSATLNDLCLRVRYETGALVSHVDWFKIVHAHLAELGLERPPGSRPLAHASELETAVMLALQEAHGRDLVWMDRARAGHRDKVLFEGVDELEIAPSETPISVRFAPFGAYYPSLGLDGTEHSDEGLLGDPTPATAEAGARILELVGDLIAQYVAALRKVPVTVHSRPDIY
jgi:creatinine amidohydrolase